MKGNNDSVAGERDEALEEKVTAVNDTVGKKPMTKEQAATMVQKHFRGHKAKQNKLSLADIARLADEDEKAFEKFSKKLSKKGLTYDEKLADKAAWVSKVNEYEGSEPALKRKELYEIASGYFEAKDAIAKNLESKSKEERDVLGKVSESIANGYSNLVSMQQKGDISSSIKPKEYMAAMYGAIDLALNIQEDADLEKVAKAAHKKVLKDLTEEHKSAHDRSSTFSQAVAMGAVPLTAAMEMAGYDKKTTDGYVAFADNAIRAAYNNTSKAIGTEGGLGVLGRGAGVVAAGVTAFGVYTPTMIAEAAEVIAVATGVGLGGAAAGAAVGVAGAAAAGVVTAGTLGALTAAAPSIAYGSRMLPRVLYRGAKAGLGSARDLAEAAGQSMNEGFRGMYNANRFSNVEKEIASSMQTLDLLEENLRKDLNAKSEVKYLLRDIEKKEREYASGKMIKREQKFDKGGAAVVDKDGRKLYNETVVPMSAERKNELLTQIQDDHTKLVGEISGRDRGLFESASAKLNESIAKQSSLFAEVTKAREGRDAERSKVAQDRSDDLYKSTKIRENKDAGLWNKTMGAYMDNFVNPMLLHMPKVIQDRFPKTVENAQKMADARAVERANDALLTEIARDMGIGAVAALKPGAEIRDNGIKGYANTDNPLDIAQDYVDIELDRSNGRMNKQVKDAINFQDKELEKFRDSPSLRKAAEEQEAIARNPERGLVAGKQKEHEALYEDLTDKLANRAKNQEAPKPRKTFMQAVFGGREQDKDSEGNELTERNLNSMTKNSPAFEVNNPLHENSQSFKRTDSLSYRSTDSETLSSGSASTKVDEAPKKETFAHKVWAATHPNQAKAQKYALEAIKGTKELVVINKGKTGVDSPTLVSANVSGKGGQQL